jgi:hypothetical protein
MRSPKTLLAVASLLLSTTSLVCAQDPPPPVDLGTLETQTPTIPSGELGFPPIPSIDGAFPGQFLSAAKSAGHAVGGDFASGFSLAPGQTLKFRVVQSPGAPKETIAFDSTPGTMMFSESYSSTPSGATIWEYSMTLFQEPESTDVRFWLSSKEGGWAIGGANGIPLRVSSPKTVDLGLLESPNVDFELQAHALGHSPVDQEVSLAPGDSIRFETAFPKGLRDMVTLTANPPEALQIDEVDTGRTTDDGAKIFEYTITRTRFASGENIGLEMVDMAHPDGPWNFSVAVTDPSPANPPASARDPKEPSGENYSWVSWLFDRVRSALAPVETLDHAAKALEVVAGEAYTKAQGGSPALVGPDGKPLPDDLAKAIRARGAETGSATEGMTGVLKDRIAESNDPKRDVAE